MAEPSGRRWQHWEDLPPEMEEELINKIANFVVKHKLTLLAEMVLTSIGPFTSMFAELGMGMFGPFLEFFGVDVYAALFRRKENLKRLMDLIDRLEDEERAKKEERD